MDKIIRLYATHNFFMNVPKKTELQQIASNYLPDINFEDFMKLYKFYNKKTYSVLVNDKTFSSDNQLLFRKNLL